MADTFAARRSVAFLTFILYLLTLTGRYLDNMKYSLLFATLALLGCNSLKTIDQKKDFSRYLDKIELLNTPVSYKTNNFPGSMTYRHYKLDLFEKYKPKYAFDLFGRVYKNQKFVSLIFYTVGDINTPILMTYRPDGVKIDSLILFPNAITTMGKSISEYVSLFPNRNIKILDSIYSLDIESDDWKILELKTDSLKFFIDDSGKIIKK